MYDVSPLICWQATAQPAPHCYSLAVLLLKEYQQGISPPMTSSHERRMDGRLMEG